MIEKKKNTYCNKHLTIHEIRIMGIRGRLAFRRCSPTYEKSGLYLIEFKGGGIKIGVANNLKQRLRSYKSPWIRPINTVITYQHFNPKSLEYKIKHELKMYTADNSTEYFPCIKLETLIKYIETGILDQTDLRYHGL